VNSRGEVLTAVLLGLAVAVLRCTAPVFADTRYVSPTGGAVAPYTNWTDAATNIQSALDVSVDGDTVLVTNGDYNAGSCPVSNMPCRVAITNAVTVQSVNGPLVTRIMGSPDYPDSIRCAYVGPNARLVGFTLCNGGTMLFDPAVVNTSGGGVMCEGGTVSGCLIYGNWAINGGGVMCYNGGIIQNSLVVSNSCTSLGGGAVLFGGGFIESCTVSMNNSSANGGGVYFKDGGSVANSIVYGNSAAATGDNWDTSGTNMTVEFTCTTPAADGSNNITADPLFVNPVAGDLHLSLGSPCIDAGTNASWMAGAMDIDARSRIMNSLVDMGCSEYPYYSITATSEQNGSIEPPGTVCVAQGACTNYIMTPAPDFHVLDVFVDGGSVGPSNSYYFANVASNHTIDVTFTIDQFNLVVTNSHGTAVPGGTNVYDYGATTTCWIADSPLLDGTTQYVCTGWAGSGSVPASGTQTNVTAIITSNSSLTWQWLTNFRLDVTAGTDGQVNATSGWCQSGTNVTETAIPDNGHHFVNWTGDISSTNNPLVVCMTQPYAVIANFTNNIYDITATAGSNGTISPSGTVEVANGDGTSFVITPAPNHHVLDVLVDGASVGPSNTYAFANVTNAHTINALFLIDTYTLTVATPYGTALPAGVTTNAYGTNLSCSVLDSPLTVGATQYACLGWTGSGSVPASGVGTNVSVTITNASAMTWLWMTNYWLHSVASPHGSVDVGDQWLAKDSTIVITATPIVGSYFSGWAGDVPTANTNDNPLTLTMDQARSIAANFMITTHYVSPTGSNVAPYMSWDEAATNIQEAVDSALEGELVLVTNGVYGAGARVTPGHSLSNRVVITNNILVKSVNGPAVTIIAGNGPLGDCAVRCVFITNGILDGFALTNGCTQTNGDTLYDCSGGGAYAQGGTLNNCALRGNSACRNGGAVLDGTLNNCELIGNSAGSDGGGAYGSVLNNCTLAGNLAGSDGGGACLGTLNNCIVYYNVSVTSNNISGGTANYCCTTPDPGGTSNITGEPVFVDTNAANYRLHAGSPCINSGNNACVYGSHDLDGNPRIVFGTVDIGAYEFCQLMLLSINSEHGSCTPPAGIYTNDYAAHATNSVTFEDLNGTTQYLCLGWAMTGNEPISGATNSFVMTQTNNATLTWLWKTNYWLETTAGGGGTIDLASGWYDAGSSQVMTATASNGYHLAGWTGDTNGCEPNGSQITIPMNGPRSIGASFAINMYDITATAGSNGVIAPTGTVWVAHGGSTDFAFTADVNYHVRNVVVDGVAFGPVNSYTFANVTNGGHTIMVDFAATYTGDWPCYRGPNRDSRTLEHISRWPPKELWRANIGEGYSQVVVSEGRVYVTGWTNEVTRTQDVVYCFSELSTGTNPTPLWQKSYQCGCGIDSRWKGTRATPTVDGNEIYTYSLEGRLVCFDKVTGITNWEVSVTNGSSTWGLSGSPLVEGSNVIVNAGASGVAIDKSGTRTNWFSTGKTAYSSPNAVTIGNQRTVVIVGGNSVSGVDPTNGNVLWHFAMGPETIVDPIVSGNRIWASKADNISAQGSFVMELGSGHLTNTVWRNNSVGNGNNSPVLYNGYLYYIYCTGSSVAGLLCMDYATGNKMWATTNNAGGDTFWYMSGLTMANDELVIADDKKGSVELIVAKATPSGYNETHRATNLVTGTMWTDPTLANGKLYIRTHEGTVVCYDVTAREPSIDNGLGASNLTASSAFMGGELTSTGGASTAVSVYWGPTDGGTDAGSWSNVVNVDVLSVGPFSTNITGLAGGTTYYYRCFASNVLDIAWAPTTTNFSTPSLPYVDNADGATDITPASATLNGNVTSTGGAPTTVVIYWGPTDGDIDAAAWSNSINMGVLSTGSFSSGLTGLTPNTVYYYRCRASNAAGIAWAPASTNFVARTAPSIDNAVGASGITAGSAILNGNVISTGGAPTTVVIYWGPTDGNNDSAAWSNSIDMGVISAGLYASGVSGLTTNTTYYYRCWASNAAGITWAPASTNFTTPPLPGIDNAGGPSGITPNSANLHGSLIATGAAPTTVVIYWGPTDGDTDTAAWSNSIDMGVLPRGLFSSGVTGLTSNTCYYYRCRASNTAGIAWAPSSTNFTASDSAPAFSNWLYRMKIAFPGYSRPETLLDFPALVILNTNCPNFFYTQFACTNGFDLRFVASDNTTELKYEIGSWSTADDSYVWVRLPSLSGTNTFVWAYWGNSNAAQQTYTTDGSTWANGFAGVYHMNEGGTGIRFDSSPNVNNGAVSGYEGDENTSGVIAFADHMNASGADDTNDAVVVSDSSSLDVSTQLTVSVWLKSDDWTAESMFVGKEGSFTFYDRIDEGQSNFTLRLPGITPADQVTYPVSNLSVGQWYQLVGTYDSSGTDSNFVLYVDGTQVSAITASGDITVVPAPVYIGLGADGSSPFKGFLDEIEISSVARSSNWIWAGFMNQRSNSIFSTCGSVVGNSDVHCTITADTSPYGSISPSGEVAVVFGSSQAFSITASGNFNISDVLADGSSVGATNSYTFFDVTTNHTISAVFVPKPRNLVVSSAHGVTIPAAGTNVLLAYSTTTCFVADSPVAAEGTTTQWVCTGWTGTGNIPASGIGTNTDSIVITDDSTITWNWKTQYRLDAAAGSNGDVNGGGWYDCGSNVTVTATASNECHFVDWSGDVPPACAYDNPLTLTMDQPRIITANFASGTGTYYIITATAGANGTIWPSGFVSVLENANRGFRITPISGYTIGGLIVDGSSVGATNWYEFINVTNDHTISPTFAPILAARGTPVVWLDSHGLTGDHDAQEVADPDNDGSPTWQEYIAGTDPTNRASCFSVSGLYKADNGQSVLCWDGKTGRLYSVYSKTNIMDVQWNTNLDKQPASSGAMSYTNNSDDALRKYFRIGVRLQ
jgi:hypothetical protein